MSTTKTRKITPSGVLVARYGTPREEWLRLRRDGLGGSDALAILGLDPWKTRMEVYLDKTGDERAEREQTDAMAWGNYAEAPIAEWFAFKTGIKVRRCGLMRHADRPWQRVSVDRLTSDGGLLECKNTNYHRRGEWEDDEGEIVADGAEAQAQHGLAVTGLPHAWFAAQVGGQPPVIRRIERDEAFIRDLTACEEEFWQLVEARTPPALEGRASADLIARLYPEADNGKTAELSAADVALLREYRKELANESAAKGRKDEIKALITAVMGDAAIATYEGRPAARWANRSKTSVPKEGIAVLREKYPDVAAEVVTDKGFRQFGVTLKGDA
jgi:putative phage-type endonuclease